jgi:outer membrane protein assembly factor BamB
VAKPKLVPEVLDLTADAKLGKQLAKAFVKGVKLDAILKLLGDRVEPNRLPAWITWHAGKDLDSVGHLGEPLFCATAADEDEFFGEPENEIVLDEYGVSIHNGSVEPVTVKKPDPATLTAYEGGGYLLANITWCGKAPAAIKDARKLLAGAFAAASGDLPAYERAEPEVKGKANKQPAGPIVDATMTGVFLGNPARTGTYAGAITKKKPKVRWSVHSGFDGGGEYGGSPVIDETLGLVFAGDYAFNAKVCATKLADGKTAWKVDLTKNQTWLTGDVVVADGVLYVPCNKQLFALDAKTGKQKWVANVTGVHSSPVVVGNVVLIGAGEGVLALSLDKGRKQWLFKVKRDDVKLGVRGGLAFADGVIYFIAEEKLFAVEVATQKKLWTVAAYGTATPSVDATYVYAWSMDGIMAVDRKTGKRKWLAKVEPCCNKPFSITNDRLLTRAEGKLSAFDLATGKLKWAVGLDKPYTIGTSSPAVGGGVAACILIDDNTDKRALVAVDIASGKQLWKIDKMGDEPFSWYCTPAVTSDGTVLVQAYGLHALT